MGLLSIFLGFLVIIISAYFFYGHKLAREFGVSKNFITPAHQYRDDADFVPTKPFYLFSQHFSAIAAAGPIAGPIIACLTWGWLPCILWILLGVILIGAVHDFASLTWSVRTKGQSIAKLAGQVLGTRAGIAMMIFIWLALIYVITAFCDMTAASFVGVTEELTGLENNFNPGGAVACGAILYLALAIIMGIFERVFKPPLWLTTIIFVPLSFIAVWLGTQYSMLFILEAKQWALLILAYCFIGSLLPVWVLLQPRGYLGGFFLYSVLIIGLIGICFGNFEIKQPAFVGLEANKNFGSMIPFLFVTIACGACSGFHGLVCSGTTSKQIDREPHVHPIGYGAMLCEGLVAVLALSTIMIFSPSEVTSLKPGTIYGKGIGQYLTMLVGPKYLQLCITFGAMAFSTFVFDTLDVATKLGRYLLQELFSVHNKFSSVMCTLATIGLPMFFIMTANESSYLNFWTLFGASNQLLAALSLLAITTWLYNAKMRISYTLWPMLFVLIITLWALGEIVITALNSQTWLSLEFANGLIAMMLIILALYLVLSAIKQVIKARSKNPSVAFS